MLLERSAPTKPSNDIGPPDATDVVADRSAILVTAGAVAVGLVAAYPVQLVAGTPVAVLVALLAGVGIGILTRPVATTSHLGALAWFTLTLVATLAVFELAGVQRHRVSLSMGMVALGATAAAVVWVVDQARRQQLSSGEIRRRAARIFTEPTTAWAPVVVGAGIALPLVGSYGPYTIDSDSAWMAAAMQEVRDNGIELLQHTHDSFLPHLTLSPLIALDGHRAAVLFTIGTMVALSSLTAFMAVRLSGRGLAAFAAPAVLMAMPGLVHQVDYYPMYAAAYAFAYGSAWILHRAMSGAERSRWLAVAAGAGFVLAYEAHSVVQTFLLVPFLLLLLHPWKRAREPFGIALLTIAVASVPRAVMNFSIGGFEGVRTIYNNTWFVQQGYLREINQNFHGQDADKSPIKYVGNLRAMVEDAVGGWGLLLLLALPVAVAVAYAGRRARVFGVAVTFMFFLALVVAGPGTYSRYVTPLAAGLALVVAVGITRAVRDEGVSRLLGHAMVVLLLVAAFNQTVMTVEDKVDRRAEMAHSAMADLVSLVDDDRNVLGIRSQQLTRVDPRLRTMSGRKMTEEDFITYVSWPGDEEIRDLVDRYDVGWVYVMASPRTEVHYHETWVEPHYGVPIRHPLRLAASDDFCLVADIEGQRLYRYGACRPTDEGVEGLGIQDYRLNPFREAAGLPPLPEPYDGEAVPGHVVAAER